MDSKGKGQHSRVDHHCNIKQEYVDWYKHRYNNETIISILTVLHKHGTNILFVKSSLKKIYWTFLDSQDGAMPVGEDAEETHMETVRD